jgi:hypothetical protein
MIILRSKLFFEYGITSQDISNYAFGNNLSKKDAYNALKQQRSNVGVAQNAFKDNDKSTFKASVLQGSKDANGKLAQGVVGQSGGGNFTVTSNKTSSAQQAVQAQQAHAANTNRAWADKNKYANIKKQNQAFTKGQQSGFQQGQQSVGLKQGAMNTWNNMSKGQKIGAGVAAGAAAIGATAMIANSIKNKRKAKEAEERAKAAEAKARY